MGVAAVAVAFTLTPLAALAWKAPWSSLGDVLASSEVRTALALSVACSVSAAVLSVVFGTPLAWVLARTEFRGRGAVRALTTLSMVMPPVVSGVALLAAFGRRGLLGRVLDSVFGVRLPFTTAGAILAETFVALPFLVVTLDGAFSSMDRRAEEAAATLGASRWTTFRTITVPAAAPSLIAGTVLAWARALGEFGATITFAGNFPGRTQTVPIAVYLALETDPGAAIVLSLILVATSFAVIVALRGRWVGALAGSVPAPDRS